MSIGPSVRAFRHDIDELLERFEAPRTLRRELDRILGDGVEDDVSRRRSWWRSGRSAPRRPWATLLLDRMVRAAGLSKRADPSPAEDLAVLTERSDCYVVRVELPDVRERDIDVRLDGEVLTIAGEHHHEAAKREQGCAYTERHYNSFTRSIELPRGVDSHRIEAHYVQGVLEVVLPKRESPRTKQIPIVRHEVRAAGDRYEERRRMPDANGVPLRRPIPASSIA